MRRSLARPESTSNANRARLGDSEEIALRTTTVGGVTGLLPGSPLRAASSVSAQVVLQLVLRVPARLVLGHPHSLGSVPSGPPIRQLEANGLGVGGIRPGT